MTLCNGCRALAAQAEREGKLGFVMCPDCALASAAERPHPSTAEVTIKVRTVPDYDPSGFRPGFIHAAAVVVCGDRQLDAWAQGPTYEDAMGELGRIIDRRLEEVDRR